VACRPTSPPASAVAFPTLAFTLDLNKSLINLISYSSIWRRVQMKKKILPHTTNLQEIHSIVSHERLQLKPQPR
jgi:hypothetical protein